MAPLAIPPLSVVVWVAACRQCRLEGGGWVAVYAWLGMLSDRADAFLNTNLADPSLRSFLADIFVLNFQWIYTVTIAAAAGWALLRPPDERGRRGVVPGCGLFLALTTTGLVYAVTRYRGYNNARYVLVAAPVAVLLFYRALLYLVERPAIRRATLSVAAVLVFASVFYTIDPVSKATFGTFRFGSHEILDMPSIMGGQRLDSLVYNLEALEFSYLLRDVMKDVRPPPRTVFFMGETSYFFPPAVDRASYDLTLDPSRALPLTILANDDDVMPEKLGPHLGGEGDRFYYLAFPNARNRQLDMLRSRYPVTATKRYNRRGYSIELYTFRFERRA